MSTLLSRALLAAVLLAAGTATAEAAAAASAQPAAPAAAETAPTSTDLLRQAAEAAAKGDRLGALQLYQSAIIYAPTDPEPYLTLAQFHAHNMESELAQKYYTIVLELDPSNPRALAGLALLSLAAGDRVAAEARHDLLVKACGPTCPETIQVAQALGAATGRPN